MAQADPQDNNSSPFLTPLRERSAPSAPFSSFAPVPMEDENEPPEADRSNESDSQVTSPSVLLDRNEIIKAKQPENRTSYMQSLKPLGSEHILETLKQDVKKKGSSSSNNSQLNSNTVSDPNAPTAFSKPNVNSDPLPTSGSAIQVNAFAPEFDSPFISKTSAPVESQLETSVTPESIGPADSWSYVPQNPHPPKPENLAPVVTSNKVVADSQVHQNPEALTNDILKKSEFSRPLIDPASASKSESIDDDMNRQARVEQSPLLEKTASLATTKSIEPPPAIEPQAAVLPKKVLPNNSGFKTVFPVVTGPTVPGMRVAEQLGVVSSEILVPKDLILQNPAPYGELCRIKAAEDVLKRMKNTALQELTLQGNRLGANALVGLTMQYGQFDANVTLLFAYANAVKALPL